MLDGWYCRSIASMRQAEAAGSEAGAGVAGTAPAAQPGVAVPAVRPLPQEEYSTDSSSSDQEPEVNYRAQYLALKKKLKYLIYENECFQDSLRSSQRRLLKVSRDRTFLLDRLLQYEKPDSDTSETDETESSDDGEQSRAEQNKKKRPEPNASQHNVPTPPVVNKGPSTAKRKRAPAPRKPPNQMQAHQSGGMTHPKVPPLGLGLSTAGDGHMTPEEVERHLQSRQSYLELLPERAPPTVPTEMFSNDPSLDSGLRVTSRDVSFALLHTCSGYRKNLERAARCAEKPGPSLYSESNDILENSPNVDEWVE